MTFYSRGGRGGRDVTPPVDWDQILRRQSPNLRRPLLGIIVVFSFWLFFTLAPRFYTDYRWFDHLGFASVLTTQWLSRLAIFFISGGAFLVFYLINVTIARHRRVFPLVTARDIRRPLGQVVFDYRWTRLGHDGRVDRPN